MDAYGEALHGNLAGYGDKKIGPENFHETVNAIGIIEVIAGW